MISKNRLGLQIATLCALVFLPACAIVEDIESRIDKAIFIATRKVDTFDFKLTDGEVRKAYTYVTDQGAGADGTIVYIGGSGCRDYELMNVFFGRLTNGSYRVVALNKAGVDLTEPDCSDEFVRRHTVSSYAADLTVFAREMWRRYPSERRIVFGVSEGGWVGPAVAQAVPATTHLVLFASGGGTGWERGLANARAWGDAKEEARITALYKDIEQRTDLSTRIFGDFSVGYTVDRLPYTPMSFLQGTRLDILVAHGGKDEILPLHLARLACDRLAGTRNRVSYVFEPEGDHGMVTPDRQSGRRFYDAFHAWTRGEPSPHLLKTCPF